MTTGQLQHVPLRSDKSVKLPLHWKTALVTAFCAVVYCQPGLAQPANILTIDVANQVRYTDDTAEVSRFATDPSLTTAIPTRNFRNLVAIGDIVAVNGQPVRGTVVANSRDTIVTTTPNPGQGIADIQRNNIVYWAFEILDSDGSQVGTIFLLGLGAGPRPPGAPLQVAVGNNAIVGGTGAFLGARGYLGQVATSQTVAPREASITEDPSSRIRNGGGSLRFMAHLIPMSRPEILATSSGPAVFHADFSGVTAANPAKAGEVLIARATGLGSTRPGIDPGKPFPLDMLQEVNSPVQVTVNGQSAEVINKIGWPGATDNYRVDFRVPDGATSGTAAIQLTAAWIAGASVNIPIQ